MPDAQPHEHPDISKFTDEKLTELVTSIRARRLRLRKLFEETERLKNEATEKKVREQIEKQLNIFERELTRLDKALDKAIDRGNKMIALLLSIGYDTTDVHKLIDIIQGEDT